MLPGIFQLCYCYCVLHGDGINLCCLRGGANVSWGGGAAVGVHMLGWIFELCSRITVVHFQFFDVYRMCCWWLLQRGRRTIGALHVSCWLLEQLSFIVVRRHVWHVHGMSSGFFVRRRTRAGARVSRWIFFRRNWCCILLAVYVHIWILQRVIEFVGMRWNDRDMCIMRSRTLLHRRGCTADGVPWWYL